MEKNFAYFYGSIHALAGEVKVQRSSDLPMNSGAGR